MKKTILSIVYVTMCNVKNVSVVLFMFQVYIVIVLLVYRPVFALHLIFYFIS